jgi:hypothetical protein
MRENLAAIHPLLPMRLRPQTKHRGKAYMPSFLKKLGRYPQR